MEIREELKQEGVLEKVRSQERWRETLQEMGPERLARKAYEAEREGRGRGWTRKKWIVNFKQ